MGSFRVFVERQRADPIAAKFLSVARSAIRLRALRFSPLLPITITPHHHEKIRFRARHLRHPAMPFPNASVKGKEAQRLSVSATAVGYDARSASEASLD